MVARENSELRVQLFCQACLVRLQDEGIYRGSRRLVDLNTVIPLAINYIPDMHCTTE
jgi:hypothetical protein